jgi:hypothetical protein
MENKIEFEDIFKCTVLSEPLSTYKTNIISIVILVNNSLNQIYKQKTMIQGQGKRVNKVISESEGRVKKDNDLRNKTNDQIADLEKMRMKLSERADFSEDDNTLQNLIKEIELSKKEILRTAEEIENNRLASENLVNKSRDAYEELLKISEILNRQIDMLLPMSFIYIVTIWDAFVSDTARTILKSHPQVISKSDDKTDITKSNLWIMKSVSQIKSYLIEQEVNKLERDREKLIKCFRDDWGIDWKQSKLDLDKIIEIRARRDIWVHNRGIVNTQYLQMSNRKSKYKVGEVATIDKEYLFQSADLLTFMAVYIHRFSLLLVDSFGIVLSI